MKLGLLLAAYIKIFRIFTINFTNIVELANILIAVSCTVIWKIKGFECYVCLLCRGLLDDISSSLPIGYNLKLAVFICIILLWEFNEDSLLISDDSGIDTIRYYWCLV